MKKGVPLWRQQRHLPRKCVPLSMRPWLSDAASLTQRLRQACQGRFQVQVVSQGRERPLRDERHALGMRDHEYALVRMVYLLCGGQPWVFARTVIPLRTLSGAQRRLGCLGTRPLGEMLFADRSMRRSEVEVVRLAPESVLFGLATAGLAQPPQAPGRPLSASCLWRHLSIPARRMPKCGERRDAQESPIWGRRSVFYLQDKPLLVSEFFLPELMGVDT